MTDPSTPAHGTQAGAASECGPSAGARLNQLLAQAGLNRLDSQLTANFETYLSLILRWNARVNLTAIRKEEDILARHFVESIACAQALPTGIATLLDFGSGAGFPGIPIALCRPEIAVTLAESDGKKAAFLHEAIRTLGISARVYAGRAEELQTAFDCVALRAVDKMPKAVGAGAHLVAPGGWLALMTTEADRVQLCLAAGEGFDWAASHPTPDAERRQLELGRRKPVAG